MKGRALIGSWFAGLNFQCKRKEILMNGYKNIKISLKQPFLAGFIESINFACGSRKG